MLPALTCVLPVINSSAATAGVLLRLSVSTVVAPMALAVSSCCIQSHCAQPAAAYTAAAASFCQHGSPHLEFEALHRPLVECFMQLLVLFMPFGIHHATHAASAGTKVALHGQVTNYHQRALVAEFIIIIGVGVRSCQYGVSPMLHTGVATATNHAYIDPR